MSESLTIEWQGQPTINSCVSTCLAMILNKPAEEIIEKYHDKLFVEGWSEGNILRDLKIPYLSVSGDERQFIRPDEVYLLGVPSLNQIGLMHSVVVETFSVNENLCFAVFDPSQGFTKNHLYYSHNAEAENSPLAIQLQGWVISAIIPRNFVIQQYENKEN